jgi:DNA repair exonuclease SbcCD ATPase subunit
MTTNDVISTLESAHQTLASMLRDNEAQIAKLNALVQTLESRITYLEGQLESARAWGRDVTEQRNRALDEHRQAKDTIEAMQTSHEADLKRLKDIIFAVHSHINPVVNPPYTPKPGEQPRDSQGRFLTWHEMTKEQQDANPQLEPMADPMAESVDPFRSLPDGVTSVPLDDPKALHEAIREATGEPEYPRAVGETYRW